MRVEKKSTIEQKNKQFRKFRRKGQSMDVLTQSDCDLISLVINCETYLQNQKKYCLNEIVMQEELNIYFDIVLGQKQELTDAVQN